jgi:VIT1/CCC1 family predicted Fe2+/Mn2+ transporter
LFHLTTAIIISIIWGLSLIALFSFYIAREKGASPYKIIIEHLVITSLVIIATHYLGDLIAGFI